MPPEGRRPPVQIRCVVPSLPDRSGRSGTRGRRGRRPDDECHPCARESRAVANMSDNLPAPYDPSRAHEPGAVQPYAPHARHDLSAAPPADVPGIAWRRYLTAIIRYKWLVLAVTAVAALAGAALGRTPRFHPLAPRRPALHAAPGRSGALHPRDDRLVLATLKDRTTSPCGTIPACLATAHPIPAPHACTSRSVTSKNRSAITSCVASSTMAR